MHQHGQLTVTHASTIKLHTCKMVMENSATFPEISRLLFQQAHSHTMTLFAKHGRQW